MACCSSEGWCSQSHCQHQPPHSTPPNLTKGDPEEQKCHCWESPENNFFFFPLFSFFPLLLFFSPSSFSDLFSLVGENSDFRRTGLPHIFTSATAAGLYLGWNLVMKAKLSSVLSLGAVSKTSGCSATYSKSVVAGNVANDSNCWKEINRLAELRKLHSSGFDISSHMFCLLVGVLVWFVFFFRTKPAREIGSLCLHWETWCLCAFLLKQIKHFKFQLSPALLPCRNVAGAICRVMMPNKRAGLVPWYFTLPLPLADYQRFQFFLSISFQLCPNLLSWTLLALNACWVQPSPWESQDFYSRHKILWAQAVSGHTNLLPQGKQAGQTPEILFTSWAEA